MLMAMKTTSAVGHRKCFTVRPSAVFDPCFLEKATILCSQPYKYSSVPVVTNKALLFFQKHLVRVHCDRTLVAFVAEEKRLRERRTAAYCHVGRLTVTAPPPSLSGIRIKAMQSQYQFPNVFKRCLGEVYPLYTRVYCIFNFQSSSTRFILSMYSLMRRHLAARAVSTRPFLLEKLLSTNRGASIRVTASTCNLTRAGQQTYF